MDSESQIALLLAQVDAGLRELEHTVENFEQAVAQAEQCMDEAEAQVQAGTWHEEDELRDLTRNLQASQDAALLVRVANGALNDALTQAETALSTTTPTRETGPLVPGTLICDGRYRLLHVLYSRPRIHLYLARRQSGLIGYSGEEQPLVVIRELVLTGLAPSVRQNVVRAAFEEFAAPQLFGSAHLPGVGDHLYLEEGRHYLVMQPRQARGSAPASAQPLSEGLNGETELDLSTALHLGIRLCQTVARLHRLNLFVGELTPALLLVDPQHDAVWAPLLLAAWPPAPHFWPGQSKHIARQIIDQIFPSFTPTQATQEQESHPFAAPELFAGQRDACSDVYALGAMLYLLCTGYFPASAAQRLRSEQTRQTARATRQARRAQAAAQAAYQDPTLVSPRQLNPQISPLLEQIFLRALALKPEQRFASARDLAEALESMHLKTELPDTPAIAPPFPRAKASRLRRLFEWLKR